MAVLDFSRKSGHFANPSEIRLWLKFWPKLQKVNELYCMLFCLLQNANIMLERDLAVHSARVIEVTTDNSQSEKVKVGALNGALSNR